MSNLTKLQKMIDEKQAGRLKFKDGTMKVDLFSASAILNIYNQVNDANKAKLEELANGTKADFQKLHKIVFKILNK
jgi:hypothetical protein